MWSKEHKRLTRRGWSENQIQAHFKEREIIEYQRYNQATGKINANKNDALRNLAKLCIDMQMDSPDPTSVLTER